MTDTNTDAALQAEELEALKAKADLLGVKYHPSISSVKLSEKIKEFQAAQPETGAGASDPAGNKTSAVPATPKVETEGQRRERIRADAEKLIRIRVTCMNPAKKDWPGEIISVGNRAVGTLKKFVPFNAEDGWHVPNMIYQVMKGRECQIFVTVKSKNGVSVRKGKLIKEFGIEVMDQLTAEELNELARRQAMAAGQE